MILSSARAKASPLLPDIHGHAAWRARSASSSSRSSGFMAYPPNAVLSRQTKADASETKRTFASVFCMSQAIDDTRGAEPCKTQDFRIARVLPPAPQGKDENGRQGRRSGRRPASRIRRRSIALRPQNMPRLLFKANLLFFHAKRPRRRRHQRRCGTQCGTGWPHARQTPAFAGQNAGCLVPR